jgi:hypothetical protein
MATALKEVTKNQPPTQQAPAVIPIKVGIFGGQGTGKTTTAAMLALALSKELHNGAPVVVTDTEPGWQFLRPMFATEGVELIQRTTPTFKAMLADMREADRIGACVWSIDSLTVIWQELMQSFKKKNGGRIPINVWGDIKEMWGEYATLYRNLNAHGFALGRLGNVMEEIEDEQKPGDTKLVKTGTQFKAGGGESFGYEPDLLLELSLERKAKVKLGSKREGEGRMTHRADVLKDRTWALNGKVLRFSDKPRYEKGGYKTVWDAIKPHFQLVQQTMAAVKIDSGQSSASLISNNGNSEFYERRQRRDVLVAEFYASIELLWGGTAKAEKQMRLKVFERIFGFRTKESAEAASLETIERGVRIMQMFEQRCKAQPDILLQEEAAILETLDKDIDLFEKQAAEEEDLDLPFGEK